MKKFILSILAVLYLITSTGATIHLHYCMGKLVDWALWNNNGSKCNNCGMEKSHNSMDQGCCKDEFKHIKNDKDQTFSDNFTHLSKTIVDIGPISTPNYSISLPLVLCENFSNAHAPPRSCVTPLNIINCVFLI